VVVVRFVDRVEEMDALRRWCSVSRYCPLYIYGPEGCGKTRLVREFVEHVDEVLGGDTLAVYIDALEATSVGRALRFRPSLATDVAKLIAEALPSVLAGLSPVGTLLAVSIPSIVEAIARRLTKSFLRGRRLVIVVDDVSRAIGLDRVEWYVKWLHELSERLAEDYDLSTVSIIVTTSEGTSLDIVSRHRHAEVRLLWNLDREGFKELLQELKPPPYTDFETVWRLLGGNPGKLIELATRFGWSVEQMMQYHINRIERVIDRVKAMNAVNELRELATDIHRAEREPSEKMLKLIELLIDNNLLIYKKWMLLTDKQFTHSDPELGIGEKYAWQTPLYREAVLRILENTE